MGLPCEEQSFKQLEGGKEIVWVIRRGIEISERQIKTTIEVSGYRHSPSQHYLLMSHGSFISSGCIGLKAQKAWSTVIPPNSCAKHELLV